VTILCHVQGAEPYTYIVTRCNMPKNNTRRVGSSCEHHNISSGAFKARNLSKVIAQIFNHLSTSQVTLFNRVSGLARWHCSVKLANRGITESL
jgi:hypothetical protein